MAYGDVKEHFSKGELNDLWNFIEFVGEIFPSKRDNIEKLKNSFIRYALVKPWPLGNDEEPEFFEIKLWAREYADFNYYIGLGVGLKAGGGKSLMRVRHPLTSKARFFPPASREPSKNPSPIKQRFPKENARLSTFWLLMSERIRPEMT